MKILSTLILSILLVSCGSTESWNDVYNAKFHPEGHHNLACTNDEATIIAGNALKEKYPRHYQRFLEVGFNHWSPVYGDYKGEMIQRYTYKSVLAYKILKSESMQGSHKIESIEVSLSKDCAVLGVDYFKGKVDWII
jgi:hypothetical protein